MLPKITPSLFLLLSLLFVLIAGTSSSSLVKAEGLQGDKFKDCFCYNMDTNDMCHADWRFFNVSSCVDWFIMILAWVIGIFIVSTIFFFATCFCCCAASASSSCFCFAPSNVTKSNSRKVKIYYGICFFLVCGCLAGLVLTSESWAKSSSGLISTSENALFDLIHLMEDSASAVKNLGSYPDQAASDKYSNVPTFVTTEELTEADVDVTAASDTTSVINDIFPILKKYMNRGKPYSRSALVGYLCGLVFFALLCILGAAVMNKREFYVGAPGGVFSFSSYLMTGFFIGTAMSLTAVTSDVCSVFDSTFAPAMRNVGKYSDACDRDYVMTAASSSLNSFATYIYDNRLSVDTPCSTIRFLDSSAEPNYGCRVPFAKINFTSYPIQVYNITPFGDALKKIRVSSSNKQKKYYNLTECAASSSSTSSGVTFLQRSACSRLLLFQNLIYSNVVYLSYTAFPETNNCNILFNSLTQKIKPHLCGEFYSSVEHFSIAGGAYLVLGLVTLVIIRWGVRHFKSPQYDENESGLLDGTSRRFEHQNVPVAVMHVDVVNDGGGQSYADRRARTQYVASDIESLDSYPTAPKGYVNPPEENSHYTSYHES